MSVLTVVFVLSVLAGLGIVGLFAWIGCAERLGDSRRANLVLALSMLLIVVAPFAVLSTSFVSSEMSAAFREAGPVAILCTVGGGIVVGLLLEFVIRDWLRSFIGTLTDAELAAYHLDYAIRGQRVPAWRGSVTEHLIEARRALDRLSRPARGRHQLLAHCFERMLEIVSSGIGSSLWADTLEFCQVRITEVGVGFVMCEEVERFTPKFEVNSDLLPPEVRRQQGEVLWRLRKSTQIPEESGGRGPGYAWITVSVGYLPLTPQQRHDRSPASSSGGSVVVAAL